MAAAILPSPQSGEMFIDTLMKKEGLAPEERNVLFQMSAQLGFPIRDSEEIQQKGVTAS